MQEALGGGGCVHTEDAQAPRLCLLPARTSLHARDLRADHVTQKERTLVALELQVRWRKKGHMQHVVEEAINSGVKTRGSLLQTGGAASTKWGHAGMRPHYPLHRVHRRPCGPRGRALRKLFDGCAALQTGAEILCAEDLIGPFETGRFRRAELPNPRAPELQESEPRVQRLPRTMAALGRSRRCHRNLAVNSRPQVN